MSIKAWPFLVSRNRYLDYRTIVAPEFICESKIANLLARVTEGDLTHPQQGIMRKVIGSKVGDFTVMFRVIEAIEKDLNPDAKSTPLKDEFGREIYLFVGVVIQGLKDIVWTQGIFETVHKQVIPSYREFFNLIDPPHAIPSQPFFINQDLEEKPLEVKELESFKAISKAPRKPHNFQEYEQNHNIENRQNSSFSLASLIKTKLLIPVALVLIVATGIILTRALLSSESIQVCTATTTTNIDILPNQDISSQLQAWKKKNLRKDDISLLKKDSLTFTKEASFDSSSIDKLDKTSDKNMMQQFKPTFTKNNRFNRISYKLEYHPLDDAIKNLKNQQVVQETKINIIVIRRMRPCQ